MTEIRRRQFPENEDEEPLISKLTEDEREAMDTMLAKKNRNNLNASTVLWMIAALIVFNMTDFANMLMNDERIKEDLLRWGCGCILVNIVVGIYLIVGLSYLQGKRDWENHVHPSLIPVATIFAVAGFVLCTVALWPVWGGWTIPILFVLFMGTIMGFSLMPF
eukprot:sb/3472687/